MKGAGVDCGQFLAAVYEATGISPPYEARHERYPVDWYLHRSQDKYLAYLRTFAHQIPGPPKPGDIVLYRYGLCISHSAIVINWPKVIHASAPCGMVMVDDALANSSLATHQDSFWSPWGE